MALKDLNQLARELGERYSLYNNQEIILPSFLKNEIREIEGSVITYLQYTTLIQKNHSQIIVLPNQWFAIASFWVEYLIELYKYKEKIVEKFTTNEIKQFKNSQEAFPDERLVDYSVEDRSFLKKFLTDYSWWEGNKTIDRGDFKNSPLLKLAGVIHDSHTYIVNLVDFFINNPQYIEPIQSIAIAEERHIAQNNLQDLTQNEGGMHEHNLILYGAPGTGKSTEIKKRTGSKGNQTTVTFHPDSDYASFVGAYKPVKIGEGIDSKITYDFVPQAFTNAYIKAWKSPTTNHYLVIEEINRGNCAQIFGDIFQLLDRKDNGYSEYLIDVDSDLANYLKKELGKFPNYLDKMQEIYSVRSEDYSKIALPNNLYILATMNTSDQSLFPMDSAFKRRWSWEYMPIDYKDAEDFIIEIGDNKYNWAKFLKFVNPIIKELTGSEDKQLGNRFVSPASKIISFNEFRSKVLFYLWFEIFKEETGSSETIFKIMTNDAGEEKKGKEIYFGDLFSDDKKTDETLIKQFLEYNKVEVVK